MAKLRRLAWAALVAGSSLRLIACAEGDEAASEQSFGKLEQGLAKTALPGGTTLEVDFVAPLDGALVPSSPLAVEGTAAIGLASPVPTDLIYVLDVSGSTSDPGCDGDPNGDGEVGTILDCEIAALLAVTDQVIDAGSVDRIGLVVFGADAAPGDLSPAAGVQQLVAPDADADGNGVHDIEQVLRSASSLSGLSVFSNTPIDTSATSFGAAINSLVPILNSSTAARKLVLFLSDGQSNTPPSVASASAIPGGTIVNTIAVSSAASCTGGAEGTLLEITGGGGACIQVSDDDLGDLPNLAPALFKSQLTEFTLSVDGTGVPSSISPALPQDGPAAFTWESTVAGLPSGPHELCATARGNDAGGENFVTECIEITVNSPPQPVCKALSLSADNACSATGSIDGGSSDPDGNLLGCTQAPPGPYALSSTTVTLTCVDSLGATASCSSVVTVSDTTPPVFTEVPEDIVTKDAKLDLRKAKARDKCGSPVTISNDAPARFACGTTNVRWTATDRFGNAAVAVQKVKRVCGGHGH